MQHGGKRRGAGRKQRIKTLPAPAPVPQTQQQTPEEFLATVMNDPEVDRQARMDAAELLMRYGRGGGRGKKASFEEAAKAATGRFATPAAPTLVVNNER
jgi:hypothetical protein